MSKKTNNRNYLKIIGGTWKGKKFTFPDAPDLRPTLSRTRETLFNWLRPYIINSSCLDLFAGSGSLGFEAISQGAANLTFIEKDRRTVQHLKSQASLFDPQIMILHQDAIKFLSQTSKTYDIVFLDPPYAHPNLIDEALSVILQKKLVTQFLYVETLNQNQLNNLEKTFPIALMKSSKNGLGRSALFKTESRE